MLEMRDSQTLIHWKDRVKAWLIGLSVARSHVGAYLFCPELAENSSIFDLPVLGPWRRNKRTKMYGLRTWLTTKRYHLLESRNVRTMICRHMRNKTIHAMSDKCAHGFSIFVSILWPLGLRQFATVCYLVKSALPQDDITAVVPEIVDPDAISPKDGKDAEACPDNLLG